MCLRQLVPLLFLIWGQVAADQGPAARHSAGESDGARVFQLLRPSVVALHTSLNGSLRRTSSGSGFQIDRRGWIVTNFHVVANFLYQPGKYMLRFTSAAGAVDDAEVVAIDVVHDLALLAPKKPLPPGLARPIHRSWLATEPEPVFGDPVFAIGNPFDLGFTLSGGTYSGVVQGSFDQQIHFTGALNPGMSGGPAVDRFGHLIGVNVARSVEGELVSFLVPAAHVTRLYRAARHRSPLAADALRPLLAEQLADRQAQISALAFAQPWTGEILGSFRVPVFLEGYSDCTASSDESPDEPLPVSSRSIRCELKTSVLVKSGSHTATLSYRHTALRAREDGLATSFQLAAAATPHFLDELAEQQTADRSSQVCRNTLARTMPPEKRPVRLVWCAQAYRDFPDLYDFRVAVAIHGDGREILISRLDLSGFGWHQGLGFTRRLLESLR